MIALVLNLALAAWLVVSAFVLPHSTASLWNELIVAALVAGIAFFAFAAPGWWGLHYLNTAVAFWLLAAVFVIPNVAGQTVLNEVFLALALALVSLVPPHRRRGEGSREPAHATG